MLFLPVPRLCALPGFARQTGHCQGIRQLRAPSLSYPERKRLQPRDGCECRLFFNLFADSQRAELRFPRTLTELWDGCKCPRYQKARRRLRGEEEDAC